MEPEAHDRDQALVLAALRERAGPVSYDELRSRGVTFPASVVEELELAGLDVERCWELDTAGERRVSGVRLRGAVRPRQPRAPEPSASETTDATLALDTAPRAEPAVHSARLDAPTEPLVSPVRRRGGSHDGPLLLTAALITALGAVTATVIALVLALSSGEDGAGRVARSAHTPHVARSAAAARGTRGAHAAATPATASGAEGAPRVEGSATQLEERGHALLTRGAYAQAVPVLRAALRATGRHLPECVEPESESCLTYAYAMYDLGRALQLSGQRAAAVPVLERRLQIDNQRAVVREALEVARTPS